jgi:hypothetical protein
MLTHIHMVVYTCWCWHICKGEGVGVDFDQLGEGRKIFRCSPDTIMAFGVEYCFDTLWLGLSFHMGCVALWVSFPKCPRSSKSEFGAKSYHHFTEEWSVTGLVIGRVRSAPARPVSASGQCFSRAKVTGHCYESGQWWPDASGRFRSLLEPLCSLFCYDLCVRSR